MRNFFLLLLAAAFFAATLPTATAQVPHLFSYQGIAVDQMAHPISDGVHSVTLKIYDMMSTVLYTETQPAVVFTKGVFSVSVGSVNPIPAAVAFDKPYTLGVSIDGGTELSPRTSIVSAPYSLMAGMAGGLVSGAANVVNSVNGQSGAVTLVAGTGTTISNNGSAITINSTGTGGTGIQGVQNIDGSLLVANGGGPTATISVKDGGITTAKLADASVTAAKIDAAAITAGMVLAANGTGGAIWQTGTGGLTLPFTGSVNATPGSAFAITNIGAGPGITASAGLFTVNNVNSTAFALWGTSNGTAASIGSYGANTGLGRGGFFEILNPANVSAALSGNTQGLGIATAVSINNNVNGSNALNASTTGTGRAGYFQISNGASVANVLEATTNGAGNGIVSTTINGNAVIGNATGAAAVNSGVTGVTASPAGSGIIASYVGAGIGIPLTLNNGPIKVVGNSKAAFKWTAVPANIVANYTTIDNPLTNGDPNAILFVTQLLDPPNLIYNNTSVGVWYSIPLAKWTIFNENVGAMPVNAAFNVIVFKQ